MNVSNLEFNFEKKSYWLRIIMRLNFNIVLFIGAMAYILYRGEALLILGIGAFILLLGIPFLIERNRCRYYILKLSQNDNMLNINVMDKSLLREYSFDLKEIKIVLSRIASRAQAYRLDFFEIQKVGIFKEQKRLFYQIEMFDWTEDKLKEVFVALKDYNKENQTLVKLDDL